MQNRRRRRAPKNFNERVSNIILFLCDIVGILFSLYIGYELSRFGLSIYGDGSSTALGSLMGLMPLYVLILAVFLYEGIYTHRYDFWQESRIILKALSFSFLIIIAYLVFQQTASTYSRTLIVVSFFIMIFVIPIIKLIVKNVLFKIGLWKSGVKVLSENAYLQEEIFSNSYLGYIKSKRATADIVFIDSHLKNSDVIEEQLEKEIHLRSKVMFIPSVQNYLFDSSDIFELTNIRVNLVVLQNRLDSKFRMLINILYNYLLALIILPFVLPVIGVIVILIKLDSKGPVFFRQERLGLNGKQFSVFKFRTMYINGDELLKSYLKEHPEEIDNYDIFHKYKNDPRITKLGFILRATSLDELAQIFNVLKGEMNFVGPRPYMLSERKKISEKYEEVILKVKPGITGLWQVSGRNELTFQERLDLDKWYVQNWALWRDIVILFKTVKVVLNKVGAK